jgi:hypothetical protein
MARVSKSDRADAIERLRADLNPGDTVHTVLRSVSRSGMSRSIDAYKIVDGDPHWLSYSVAKAGVGTWHDGRAGTVTATSAPILASDPYREPGSPH